MTTAAEEKERAEEAEKIKRGPAVANGELRYVSVSQCQTFDPNTYGGCNRRWWFDKVMGLGGEETVATRTGREMHARIEHYLRTGEETLGMIERAGKHFIPKPNPRYLIEHSFGDSKVVLALEAHRHIVRAWESAPMTDRPTVIQLEASRATAKAVTKQHLVTSGGIPFVGYIDLVNPTGYWLDNEGQTRVDAPNTLEVVDWKSTKTIELYAKQASDLPKSIQMIGYAEWASRYDPSLEQIRLSHGYFQTQGGPGASKRTVLIPLATVKARWQDVDAQVSKMAEVARESDPMKVAPNYASCSSFGKGCPYKARCPRDQKEVLADLFGGKGSAGGKGMSLLDKVKRQKAAGGALAPTEKPVDKDATRPQPDVAAEVERLKREEKGGTAEPERHACGKVATPENSSRPNGKLIHVGCHYTCCKGEDAPTSRVMPPDAPQSSLAESALPVSDETKLALSPEVRAAAEVTDKAIAEAPAKPAKGLKGRQAARAAQAAAALEAAKTADTSASAAGVETTPRPAEPAKLPDVAPDAAACAKATAMNEAVAAAAVAAIEPLCMPSGATVIVLFVDCLVTGFPTMALDTYVKHTAQALAEMCHAADIRCAPQDSALAYNKWKGALTAAVQTCPPPPGNYSILFPDEVDEVVIKALQPMCAMFVRARSA